MIFGTNQRLRRLDSISLNIERHYVNINNTDSYKYLGLNLNRHLNMSEHVESSLKKAVGRINLLKSMRPLLDSNVAVKIYNAMILSNLT